MKVRVDPILCKTAGRCVQLCPSVFRFTAGSKKAEALMEEVPEELWIQCRKAARNCPNRAVIITDDREIG